MDLDKQKRLMKGFIMSQFNYSLLILMFQSRKLNNIVNKIHDKSLGLTNKEITLPLENFREKIHQFYDCSSEKFTLTCYRNL